MNFEEARARFLELIDEGHEEQAYQAFLEKNTHFIPREFVQTTASG